MKAISKFLLIMFLFVGTTAFVDSISSESNIDPPVNEESFTDSKYDEAKYTYENLRNFTEFKLEVKDRAAWKEYEYFKITSHWDEIEDQLKDRGIEIVDVYFNTEYNRHLPVTLDDNGNKVNMYPDCTGMGCEYGCCEMCLGYNLGGCIYVPICCECEEEVIE